MDVFYKRSSKAVMNRSRVEAIENARKEYKELLEQGWGKTSIFKVFFKLPNLCRNHNQYLFPKP